MSRLRPFSLTFSLSSIFLTGIPPLVSTKLTGIKKSSDFCQRSSHNNHFMLVSFPRVVFLKNTLCYLKCFSNQQRFFKNNYIMINFPKISFMPSLKILFSFYSSDFCPQFSILCPCPFIYKCCNFTGRAKMSSTAVTPSIPIICTSPPEKTDSMSIESLGKHFDSPLIDQPPP